MPQAAKQLWSSSIQIFDWGRGDVKYVIMVVWSNWVQKQNNDFPKDVHILIPRTLNILLYMMWLRCRDGKIILAYLVGPKSSQRSLQGRTKEGPLQGKSRRIRVRERQREIWRCYDAGLKDEGKGHKPIWEKPGMDSPLEIPEEIQPCPHLDFSPLRFMQGLWSPGL